MENKTLNLLIIENDIAPCRELRQYIEKIETLKLIGVTDDSDKGIELVKSVIDRPDAGVLYETYREQEMEAKDLLIDFEQKYPKVVNENNLAAIIAQAKKKKAQQIEDAT